MSTTDVPGYKKENNDVLHVGCWAEHTEALPKEISLEQIRASVKASLHNEENCICCGIKISGHLTKLTKFCSSLCMDNYQTVPEIIETKPSNLLLKEHV